MKLRRWPRLLAGILALVIAGWLFSRAGYYLDSSAQDLVPVDPLVVLGGDAGWRSLKGADLFRKRYAPRLLLTGVEHSPAGARPVYLNWRAQLLVDHGVPRHAVLLDERSGYTMEEAANTLALMHTNGWRSAIVVTDPPHVRRGGAGLGQGVQSKRAGVPCGDGRLDSTSWHADS